MKKIFRCKSCLNTTRGQGLHLIKEEFVMLAIGRMRKKKLIGKKEKKFSINLSIK